MDGWMYGWMVKRETYLFYLIEVGLHAFNGYFLTSLDWLGLEHFREGTFSQMPQYSILYKERQKQKESFLTELYFNGSNQKERDSDQIQGILVKNYVSVEYKKSSYGAFTPSCESLSS